MAIARKKGSPPRQTPVDPSRGTGKGNVRKNVIRLTRTFSNDRHAGFSVDDLQAMIEQAQRLGKHVEVTLTITPQSNGSTSAAPDALDTALAAARARGARRIAEILNSNEMLSADAFAKEIGVTRETVNNKRKRHEILGLEGPKRGVRFPKWQLSAAGELLPGLPELFQALRGGPWTVYRFLLTKHPELDGKRGLDVLRAGRIAEAVEVAQSIELGAFS